ncbi:MAG: methyltransferase domain-containing protein [Bdellovibrionota bacterium]
MSSRSVWLLKKGSERKFHFGHPWVFSSELAQSPKGIEAGQLVELRDVKGTFLALGYGHPNSMISFRTLSLDKNENFDARFFCDRFSRARRVREVAGVARESHRLIFAEGDFLPGLVIDRFLLDSTAPDSSAQVFVIQTSTAGVDRLLPTILEGLELFVRETDTGASWERTAVVVANDSKSRAMEGLPAEPKKLVKDVAGFDPANARISIQAPIESMKPTAFDVDFVGGQKTGFFLDQRLNVQLAAREVVELARTAKREGRPLRILDLFCYVGQWGAQLAHVAVREGAEVEVVLVDASAKALELAAANVERVGGKAMPEKRDVVDELAKLERGAFDVVVCDPPAFVKKKKDLPQGSQAYYKVNREAIRKTRKGGLFVSCSCSGLFDETEFRSMLSRVVASFDGRVRWIARGSHSVDHPQRPEFPQGTYLKSWLGLVD